MTTKAIEHITITTGASRRSPRSEVEDRVVDLVRAGIAAGGALWDSGWTVTLQPTPEGGHVYDLSYRGRDIVRCWLCTDRERSDAIWDAATAGPIIPGTRLHRPASTPWLAAALRPDAMAAGTAVLMEVGDLERIVAWTLLE